MAKCALLVWLGLMLQLAVVLSQWQTSGSDYYAESCPNALDVIFKLTETAFAWDRKVAPELLRMSFHDCAVNGCDASLMLDDDAKSTELWAGPNRGIAGSKALALINEIKAVLDEECGPVVSCADILSVAVRDATVFIGGPSWETTLGRLDCDRAGSCKQVPAAWLPGPFDIVDAGDFPLLHAFNKIKLDAKDLVALSGAHSVGDVGCGAFSDRSAGEGPHAIHPRFQSFINKAICRGGEDEQVAMTWKEAHGRFHKANTTFNNQYYINLTQKKGLLTSDQALYEHPDTVKSVETYAADRNAFFEAFANAMVKMKELRPEDTDYAAYAGRNVKFGIRVGSCSWPEKIV